MPARTGRRAALALVPALLCAGGGEAGEPERLVVGAHVEGREVATVEILREPGAFLIPAESFARLAGCRLDVSSGRRALWTPLGSVEIAPAELREVEGVLYFPQHFIEERLATPFAFDEAEVAVTFAPPWSVQPAGRERLATPLAAEVGPPGLALATVREELQYSRYGQDGFWSSTTTLAGALHEGFWRVRLDDDLDGNRRLRDYAWTRVVDRRLLLIGQQTVQLHPLLNTFQHTGVQAAWTNQPLEIFPQGGYEARELLPRRVQPAATFRGGAPPGSLAQLTIDGLVEDQQIVGLDGFYEFLEVRLPSRQLSQVEVRIFDRHNPSAPRQIHEQTLSASEYLLRRGAAIHMGGVGRSGNLADGLLGQEQPSEAAAFYQWRQGLSDRVTLEAAAQTAADTPQALVGIVARLSRGLVLSLGTAGSRGGLGYDLDLDARGARTRLLASSRVTPGDFTGPESGRHSDHRIEGWYRVSTALDLGLVGGSSDGGESTDEYLAPALSYSPDDRLLLRARPNLDGDYRWYGSYRPGERDRLILSAETHATFDYTHDLGRRHRLGFGTAFGGDVETRTSVVLERLRGGARGAGFAVGALSSGGEAGVLFGATVPLLPGVLARADFESVPMLRLEGVEAESELRAGLTIDLTLAGRRLLPASTLTARPDRGSIAGRLRAVGTAGEARADLGDIGIRVGGRLVTKTDARGNFYVGNLEQGVYMIELDEQELPFELTPRASSVAARVSRAASTRVDFSVTVAYGIAGRVIGFDRRALPGVKVEILDGEGRVVGSAVTDRFGLYRMDRLAVGSYDLRVAPEAFRGLAPVLAPRRVEIRDEFLFGQDLVIPLGES